MVQFVFQCNILIFASLLSNGILCVILFCIICALQVFMTLSQVQLHNFLFILSHASQVFLQCYCNNSKSPDSTANKMKVAGTKTQHLFSSCPNPVSQKLPNCHNRQTHAFTTHPLSKVMFPLSGISFSILTQTQIPMPLKAKLVPHLICCNSILHFFRGQYMTHREYQEPEIVPKIILVQDIFLYIKTYGIFN